MSASGKPQHIFREQQITIYIEWDLFTIKKYYDSLL